MGENYLLMLVGMLLVTYIPRVLPLLILTRMEIPDIIIRWLRFIPVAILAALLTPGILIVDGILMFSYYNIFLIAAIPTFSVAIYKKNIFLTVITGMISVVLLSYFLNLLT